MHRFRWNLRYPGATEFPGLIMWAASTRFGPVAVPGEYRVRVSVDGETAERAFRVRMDPKSESTLADLEAQFRLSQDIVAKTSAANDAVRLIRGIEEQVEARLEEADASTRELGEGLLAELDAIESQIYQVRNRSNQDPLNFPIRLNNKIAALLGVVQSGDYAPTEQSYTIFRMLAEQLDAQLDALERTLDTRLEAFNERLEAEGLEPVERRMIPQEAPAEDGESGP